MRGAPTVSENSSASAAGGAVARRSFMGGTCNARLAEAVMEGPPEDGPCATVRRSSIVLAPARVIVEGTACHGVPHAHTDCARPSGDGGWCRGRADARARGCAQDRHSHSAPDAWPVAAINSPIVSASRGGLSRREVANRAIGGSRRVRRIWNDHPEPLSRSRRFPRKSRRGLCGARFATAGAWAGPPQTTRRRLQRRACDPRLLRDAPGLAPGAEQGSADRLVAKRFA